MENNESSKESPCYLSEVTKRYFNEKSINTDTISLKPLQEVRNIITHILPSSISYCTRISILTDPFCMFPDQIICADDPLFEEVKGILEYYWGEVFRERIKTHAGPDLSGILDIFEEGPSGADTSDSRGYYWNTTVYVVSDKVFKTLFDFLSLESFDYMITTSYPEYDRELTDIYFWSHAMVSPKFQQVENPVLPYGVPRSVTLFWAQRVRLFPHTGHKYGWLVIKYFKDRDRSNNNRYPRYLEKFC